MQAQTQEQLPREIAQSAQTIAGAQARLEDITANLGKAESWAEATASAWTQDRVRAVSAADRAGSRTRAEAADEVVSRLRAERRAAEQALYELHDAHGQLWRARRMALALGRGRSAPSVTVPDWRSDDRLRALRAKESELDTTIGQAAPALHEARAHLADVEALASTTRGHVRIGRSTAGDVKRLQQDAARLRAKVEALDTELGELQAGKTILAREREAFEEALRGAVVPELQAHCHVALAGFVESLRDCVVQSEHAWVLFHALELAGATPQTQPWPELRLSDDSKFMAFVFAAIEAGYAK